MDRFDPRGKVNRALLVGVSEYEFTRPKHRDGVPGQLPAVAHNLAVLVRALERGGVLRPLEITVARSPRLADFRHSLRAAADSAEGLLLLYFAGHGAVPSAGDELWLQMRDAEVVRGETAGSRARPGSPTCCASSPTATRSGSWSSSTAATRATPPGCGRPWSAPTSDGASRC
ncbi:caspase family protein [Streptomyces mirabilis]|nr:caspase family protein [Streptomyces mirabilis]